jgi:transposase
MTVDSMDQTRREGIVVGVDTHRDIHVAVALDALGGWLGERSVRTTRAGYAELIGWARSQGKVRAFGVEGTGSYGAGLARALRIAGEQVIEVDRPDRSSRRRQGKSDPLDAEAAARAVLSGRARTQPKDADGKVEMLRMLLLTRRSAEKARIAAISQLRAILVTAPAELREELSGLGRRALLARCLALRPAASDSPTMIAKRCLRQLARRIAALGTEIAELELSMAGLVSRLSPGLLACYGVGSTIAATLLVTAGDNPQRLGSEAAFASLCGVSPIPASSGLISRHRLNRGGDRQANAALYRVVIVRLAHHAETKAYLERYVSEGRHTKRDAIRSLKRYVARELFPHLAALGSLMAAATP